MFWKKCETFGVVKSPFNKSRHHIKSWIEAENPLAMGKSL